MNNNFAKKRIEHCFTVSQLAEKLGVTEDTVYKWENGELSPEADKLVEISKLYGITVDELLNVDGNFSENPKKDKVDISFKHGIHIESENDSVHIDRTGIHVKSADGHIVDSDKEDPVITVDGKEYSKDECKKKAVIGAATSTIISCIVVIAYIFMGFMGFWHPGWLIFMFIPIILSFIEAVKSRNAEHFAFPVLVALVYLCLGFFMGLWHPSWVLFLTIPIYYSICKCFKK